MSVGLVLDAEVGRVATLESYGVGLHRVIFYGDRTKGIDRIGASQALRWCGRRSCVVWRRPLACRAESPNS